MRKGKMMKIVLLILLLIFLLGCLPNGLLNKPDIKKDKEQKETKIYKKLNKVIEKWQ